MHRLYYINLEHRTDRRSSMEDMLSNCNFPKGRIYRYPAHYYPNHGALGCAKSHIGVITHFLESDDKFCIVLEDDFRLNSVDGFNESLDKAFSVDNWDIMMLSGNIMKHSEEKDGFIKVYEAQTTSGYVLNREFASTLLKNFREAEAGLTKLGFNAHDYCIDQYWKILQPHSRWYCFSPKVGYQESGYSDIERRNVNYLVEGTRQRV